MLNRQLRANGFRACHCGRSALAWLLLAGPGLVLATAPAVAALPVISEIPDQRLPLNRSLAVPFTVQEAGTHTPGLVIRAVSSNPALIPERHLRLAGSGAHRELILRPVLGQTGSARITVSVRDGTGRASERPFQVEVGRAAYPPGAGDQPINHF